MISYIISLSCRSLYLRRNQFYLPAAECLRSQLRFRAVKCAYFTLTCTAIHAHPAECLRSQLRFRAVKRAYFTLTCTAIHEHCTAIHAHPTECLRSQLRFRAVKRAYFTLTYTAMHAHPVRRRTSAGSLRPPTRPLRCALRLLHQNFLISFSIKLYRT